MKILELAAGIDPRLNARENRLRYLIERVLHDIGLSIDLDAPNAMMALADLDDQVRRLTGKTLYQLLLKYNASTFNLGYNDASGFVVRYHPPTPAPFTAPIRQDLVERLTGHTVSFVRDITDDTRMRLSESLGQGYRLGEGTPKLSDRVQNVMGVEKNSANRLARTMTNETYNQAHMARYKEAGIPGVQYSAARRENVCPVCRALDGTIWAIDDPGIIRPPVHENCRCRITAWLRGLPGPRKIDQEVLDVYHEFRNERFQVPLYA